MTNQFLILTGFSPYKFHPVTGCELDALVLLDPIYGVFGQPGDPLDPIIFFDEKDEPDIRHWKFDPRTRHPWKHPELRSDWPKFPSCYSAEQLDRGQAMIIHPITAVLLNLLPRCYRCINDYSDQEMRVAEQFPNFHAPSSFPWDLDYCEESMQFVEHEHGGGRQRKRYHGRIGTGFNMYELVSSYPYHWLYDPFTGRYLQEEEVEGDKHQAG